MKLKNITRYGCCAFAAALLTCQASAQFTVSANKTAAQLAAALTGSGVTVSNATLNCPYAANGTFTGATVPLGISGGILLTSGSAAAVQNTASFFSSEDNGTGGDASLSTLSGNPTFDACVLEFDFVALGDSVKFNYQFGSEEYPSYTCTQFNDVFGFFISGPGYAMPTNIARVPGTNVPVAINSVNGGAPTGNGVIANCTGMGPGSPFPAYFVNNANGPAPVYDGLTAMLTARAAVTPCATYHFKLGVADASDHVLSSGVFLQAGSLTVLPPVIVGCPADVSVNTGEGATSCSAAASWAPPSAVNNCLNVTSSATHSPGDVFPAGTTPVTYTFTNSGGSSTCTFNVTVTDNTAPVAACKDFTLDLSGGMGTVTAANIDNGSSDNCGIASMSVSPANFTCADAGSNQVTLTVTDAAGNSSSCTANVTVQYQPSCSIAVTPANNIYTGGAPANIYLGYGPQTATITANAIGGSGFTYSWSPAAGLSCTNCQSPVFTPTAGGTYTFTVTVTNSNGCSTTCDVTFCVKDIRAPKGNGKVYVCHVPPGNPGNANTLNINSNAVSSHLGSHAGDYLGACDQLCGGAMRGVAVRDMEVYAYPNPFTEGINIKIESTSKENTDIVVYDLTGKVVEEKRSQPAGTETLVGTALAKGVYMVEVKQGANTQKIRVTRL